MPLPSDVSSDPVRSVGRDECGNVTVLTKDGLAAMCTDGTWHPGFLFSARSWMDEFSDITDAGERERILSGALRQFRAAHAESFTKS